MTQRDFIVVLIAGLLQLGVAVYAFRLARLFSMARIGWSLFSAFFLLALVHLIQAVKLFSVGKDFGTEIEIVHAFVSFLLLIGFTHIELMLKQHRAGEQRARKMETMGQLASGIAHDFNNMLTIIQGYTNMLTRSKSDAETAELLSRISSAIKRSNTLTKQLMAFAKQQTGQIATFDMNPLIHQTVQMLRRLVDKRIVLKTDYASELPLITANEGMIEEVVFNLVLNACDAMPDGGDVTISTALANIDRTHVFAHPESRPGEFVCLKVRDMGMGISYYVMEHLFEPFFTTKGDKGTGLGLATVHRIIKEHCGWIEVESTEGRGTQFAVYLPCAASTTEKVKETVKPAAINNVKIAVRSSSVAAELSELSKP